LNLSPDVIFRKKNLELMSALSSKADMCGARPDVC
jgi:hypothetical protein